MLGPGTRVAGLLWASGLDIRPRSVVLHPSHLVALLMDLFPAARLETLRSHADKGHSYLQVLTSPSGARLRERLSSLADRVEAPLRERWTEAIGSDDTPRFFQGFAELTTMAFLAEAGWQVVDHGPPGPSLLVERQSEDGQPQRARVLVLAFIQPGRTSDETEAMGRLIRSINRARARHRIAVLVRRWHPHEFDPEPIRRAVDIWLRKVARGQWDGRIASFQDDHISLEFLLTDRSTRTGEGSVAFAMGPLDGFRTLEIVETRLVYELDAYQQRAEASEPLIISLATNADWALSPGFLRGMLYGRPSWHRTNGVPHRHEMAFAPGSGPALFRDAVYDQVTAAMIMDQQNGRGPCARAYLNPWSAQPMTPGLASCATFGVDRWEDQAPVMRWFGTA